MSGRGDARRSFAADVGRLSLWMVSQAPGLNALVVALQQHRRALAAGGESQRLAFSRTEVARARAEFSDMIRRGERDRHLLAERLLGTCGGCSSIPLPSRRRTRGSRSH